MEETPNDGINNNNSCIPITFINPLKFCFSNKKSYYNPNSPNTNCKRIFLIEKLFFNGFLKIIGIQI